jgi:bifunctional UDP-N-acetylglucosamine pyrophosphorylase/glucosamine-1-phosphate N-acetyltransferase
MDNCAIILAAGDGKRMKSKKPKVLCEVLFKPMLAWVISSCQEAGVEDICVVAGYEYNQVLDFLGDKHSHALQLERKGTGHAVMMANDFLNKNRGKNVLILCGDAPFMDKDTILNALNFHSDNKNSATIITASLENPSGYGRILRDENGIVAIVEQKDANEQQLLINEVNSGGYWFNVDDLLSVLGEITSNNSQGEHYLTDSISLLLAKKKRVDAYVSKNSDVILGANDRKGVFTLSEIARKRIIDNHFENGVEFVSIDGVVISPDAKIGCGSSILGGTILKGNVSIGENCTIGPNTLIENSIIGDNSKINASQVYKSKISNDVSIGPFSHIRPNSDIKSKAHIGDFVEIKNSEIGEGTSVSHLTYIGDSDVGKNVNVGCGVVTVNFDGVKKHRCVIEEGAFIGCNTNLISPVKVGKNAYTAAGSTITEDVEDGALAIARSRQQNKNNFSEKKLEGRKLKA